MRRAHRGPEDEEHDNAHRDAHRETACEEGEKLQARPWPVDHQDRHADPEGLQADRNGHHQERYPHVGAHITVRHAPAFPQRALYSRRSGHWPAAVATAIMEW